MTEKTNQKSKVVRSSKNTREIPSITVRGHFVDEISAVQGTTMSLTVGLGEVAGKKVLVPLVNLKLIGAASEDAADELVFDSTLTVENLAFLTMDLADELSAVLDQLDTLSQGGTRPEPVRLDAARRFFEGAKTRVDDCLSIIARLSATSK